MRRKVDAVEAPVSEHAPIRSFPKVTKRVECGCGCGAVFDKTPDHSLSVQQVFYKNREHYLRSRARRRYKYQNNLFYKDGDKT